MDIIKNLEALIARGQDSALIRYSLASEYCREKKFENAITHLVRAVELDPHYSAAWKLYGKVLSKIHRINDAIQAFEQGIAVAEKRGDIQAVKEMKVFLNRLKKNRGSAGA
jgi:tetratricopeptide (TPR) repeat protein